MKKEYDNLIQMIKSPDKENLQVALSILRSPFNSFDKKEQKDLLRSISIFDRGTTYRDVCYELNEEELTLLNFKLFHKNDREKLLAFAQIKQLERFFNGKWKADFKDRDQKKWYPYYEYKAGQGFVLVFSSYYSYIFAVEAGFYKDEKTSNFIGKTYQYIYKKLGNYIGNYIFEVKH